MIESIWNNIQTDWLQSPKNNKNNNNFQTLRTVRASLTVKNHSFFVGVSYNEKWDFLYDFQTLWIIHGDCFLQY